MAGRGQGTALRDNFRWRHLIHLHASDCIFRPICACRLRGAVARLHCHVSGAPRWWSCSAAKTPCRPVRLAISQRVTRRPARPRCAANPADDRPRTIPPSLHAACTLAESLLRAWSYRHRTVDVRKPISLPCYPAGFGTVALPVLAPQAPAAFAILPPKLMSTIMPMRALPIRTLLQLAAKFESWIMLIQCSGLARRDRLTSSTSVDGFTYAL